MLQFSEWTRSFTRTWSSVAAGLGTGAAESHPRTRACFFCSPAWPIAGFSNHVGRRDEGPEVSHITFPPTVLAAVTTS